MPTDPLVEDYEGWCPICEAPARFQAKEKWLRAHLRCLTCAGGSVPRERALALVLSEVRPNWRDLAIHESSPASRGISAKMKRECRAYVGSHYFPDREFGETVNGWNNQNLEAQTFPDKSFDIVVSLDVMEHVFHPERAYAEVHRTLKDDGVYIHTFPVSKRLVEAASARARLTAEGGIEHLKPAEYHGNPIDSKGALVTFDYGYDIHGLIAQWAPFSVRILRFSDRYRGILGEYTEVIVCEKRPAPA